MRKTTDRRKKKIAPIVVTALVILYILPLIVFALRVAREEVLEEAGMLLLCYAFLGGAVIAGVLGALCQRLEEIDRGEEDEASKY